MAGAGRSRGCWRRVWAALAVGCSPPRPSAADTVAFTITDPRITESSGLARDPQAASTGRSTTPVTSGIVYGLTAKGKVRGT